MAATNYSTQPTLKHTPKLLPSHGSQLVQNRAGAEPLNEVEE